MKKHILKIALVLLTIYSCSDDFLDVEPTGLIAVSTIEDLEGILNSDKTFSTNNTYMLDLSADNSNDVLFTSVNTPESLDEATYLWEKEILTNNHPNITLWSQPYANIFSYNTIINEIGIGVSGDDALKEQIVSEARLGRAFEYWLLVNSFAKQYDATTANTDLGVPLVLSSDVSIEAPARSTVVEVYNFIITELTESIDNLPTTKSNLLRASKGSAYALLSRVSLFMNDYIGAKEYADMALGENNFLADYNSISSTTSVFQKDDLKLLERKEHYYYRISDFAFEAHFLSSEFLNLYEAGDLRNTYFSYFVGFGYETLLYSLIGANTGISTPEIYLTRAECNAREGNISLAMDDLNELRSNRIESNVFTDLTATTREEALTLIFKERRIETVRNGLRWYDLKRLNKEAAYATTLTHPFQGQTHTLLPNANNYVFPIPEKVLEFNLDMVNNDRD